MISNCFLGIDIGTTNIKVALYDERLNIIHSAAIKTVTRSQQEEGSINADYLHHQVFTALQNCMLDQSHMNVQGIGICGMAEAGCLINDHNKPISPIYLWYEDHSRLFAKKIQKDLGEIVSSQSGLKVTHVRSLSKYAWLVAKTGFTTARWIGVPELVGLWLTGVYATDQTLATRTGFYNIRSKEYSREVLDYLKANRNQFPPVLDAPARLGLIDPHVGHELELKDNVSVFIAGHDDIVAAYGVNARPGDLIDSTGTAEGIIQIIDHPINLDNLTKHRIACAPFFSNQLFALITGLGTTGALIEMVARDLKLDYDFLDQNISPSYNYPKDSFQVKFEETYLPVIIKNTLNDRPYELWSALYDTIAKKFNRAVIEFSQFCDTPNRLIFIGGSANSAELCNRKSSKLDIPCFRVPKIDATTRGAAAVSGFPMGSHPDLFDQQF